MCEKAHINYIYMLDIPNTGGVASAYTVLAVGFAYWGIISFFGILACASSQNSAIPSVPFGRHLKEFAENLQPNMWVMMSTSIHFVAVYYEILGMFSGTVPKLRQLFIVMYKALTPWAHSVDMNNFVLATVLGSCGQMLRDIMTVVSVGKCPDYILCLMTFYPSLIRTIQCVKKYLVKKEAYPHLLNGSFQSLGMISCWMHLKRVAQRETWAYWLLFAFKLVETTGKTYWDLCEDASFYSGGTGVREFREKRNKW